MHAYFPAMLRRIGIDLRTLTFDRWIALRGDVVRIAGETWRRPIWAWFLLGFALLCTGLLVGPRVPAAAEDSLCVGNIELQGPFGFSLNCDSPEFMWLARKPSDLLLHENRRQSRPGLILLAALIEAPLSLIVPPAGPPTPAYTDVRDPDGLARAFMGDRPGYLAYVLLNFAILLASFGVLRSVIERNRPSRDAPTAIILVSTGLLLVANDVTKAFIWSPHTQMFNILVPVLAVYATQRAVGALIGRGFALGMGLAVGLGMTAYPVFAVIPACMLPPAIVALLREKSPLAHRRGAAHIAAFLALAAIPPALWYVIVRVVVGHFSSAELDMDEVIWMKDALGKGLDAFLAQWFGYLVQLLKFAAPQVIALGVLLAWLAATVVVPTMRRKGEIAHLSAALRVIAIGLYVSTALLGFYTCVGWIVERLAYPVIPPLVAAAGAAAVLVARQLPPGRRSILAGGFLVIALAQMIYVVAKDGPWS
jgi:hypothetical protein